MRIPLITCLAAGLLSACSGDPEPIHSGSDSSIAINRRGADVYGTTGPGWTAEELREGLDASSACNNTEKVRNLEITRAPTGELKFTGTCAL